MPLILTDLSENNTYMFNKIIKKKRGFFLVKFNKSGTLQKKRVHYESTINITNALIELRTRKEAERHMKQLVEYFNIVNVLSENDSFSKHRSKVLFNDFIFDAGRYLMHRKRFITSGSFLFYSFLGLIIDVFFYLLFFSWFIPIFMLISIAYGFKIVEKAKKEKRFFSNFY